MLLVYIDDIMSFTVTFLEHIKALREVFDRMRNEGLYLKPKKCTFVTEKVVMLGHIIDKEGGWLQPGRIT